MSSKKNINDVYRLSPLQEGMLFHSIYDRSASLYHEQLRCTIAGKLDPVLVSKSLQLVVARHDVLRTSFVYEKVDKPVQVVLHDRQVPFSFTDLSESDDLEDAIKKLTDEDLQNPFRLSDEALLRLTLIKVNSERFILLWSWHHLILDGWSLQLVIGDFLKIYQALANGDAITLPPVGQYKEYFTWLDRLDKQKAKDFWQSYLEHYTGVAALPVLQNVKSFQSTQGKGRVELVIDAEEKLKLEALVRKNQTTLSILLQTIWAICLGRHNGTSDVVFGVVNSGRPTEIDNVESIVGLFINTSPLRIQYSDTTTFNALVKNVQADLSHLVQYQYLSLAELKATQIIKEDIVDHIFVFNNYPVGWVDDRNDTRDEIGFRIVESEVSEHINYNFGISVVLSPVFRIQFNFNTAVYTKTQIEAVTEQFHEIMKQVVMDDEILVRDLNILPYQQRTMLLETFNATATDYPDRMTMHEVVERKVSETPDALAVISGDQNYSYEMINAYANGVGHYLRKNAGVEKEHVVAVMVEPTHRFIVGLLGILKAGGVYLPIDPLYPEDRIDYILRDAQVKIVIVDEKFLPRFHAFDGQVLVIDDLLLDKLKTSENLTRINGASDLAYVIYTSGTSGYPKGVMIEHRGNVNMSLSQVRKFGIHQRDRVLQFASMSFDASISEIFMAFYSGASLVMLGSRENVHDADSLVSFMKERMVTVVTLPPSYLNVVEPESFAFLRVLITAGESAKMNHATNYSRFLNYFNAYGPTEYSVCVSIHSVREQDRDRRSVPIGTPIDNTEVYILDERDRLVPVGVNGEICVSGAGLARGYLNQDALTNLKFVDHPFIKGKRMYRTGDIGRWLEDGSIEFSGRRDHQIKIRGHRIELGEIENALLRHELVKDAAVVTAELSGVNHLVAYVVTSQLNDVRTVKEYLRSVLPEFMVPTFIHFVDDFLLNIHGKIDKSSLPKFDVTQAREHIRPRTAGESVLIQVWESVLDRTGLSVNDDFFSLGGDSIKAIQIASRVLKHNYRITVRDIFENPSVSLLARKLKVAEYRGTMEVVEGSIPLSPIQHEFFEKFSQFPSYFNQAVLLNCASRLDVDRLVLIVKKIVAHHDIFRATFEPSKTGWLQFNHGLKAEPNVDVYDFREVQDPAAVLLKEFDLIQASLNIVDGPLMRVALFRLPNEDRILVAVHHLVIDTVSWRILLEDFGLLFNQQARSEKLALPMKTDSFLKWSTRLNQYANEGEIEKEIPYWNSVIGASQVIQTDYANGANTYRYAARKTFKLNKNDTRKLLTDVNKPFNTNTQDLLLAALAMAMQSHFAIDNILLGMEGHGREEIFDDLDFSRTIGWFTSSYPVRLDFGGLSSIEDIIKYVKEHFRKIPQRGVGYGILKYLRNGAISVGKNPQINFNYLGQFDENGEQHSFTISKEAVGALAAPDAQRPFELEIFGLVSGGELEIAIAYSTQQFSDNTIAALLEKFESAVLNVIAHCATVNDRVYTPSDFTFKGLSIEQVDNLRARHQFEDVYDLTPTQRGIYFHSEMHPEANTYFQQVSFVVNAELDPSRIKDCVHTLGERHDILRTIIIADGLETPMQMVLSNSHIGFQYIGQDAAKDLSCNTTLEAFKAKDREQGFDFSGNPLIRVSVLELSENRFFFVWSHHHILMDGWCIGLLAQEFFQAYYRDERNLALSTKPPQYKRYLNWFAKYNTDEARSYWKNSLAGYDHVLTLPNSKSSSPDQSYLASSFTYDFGSELTETLNALAVRCQVTLSTIIQAAWAILLARHNGVDDVAFGVVASGRPHEIAEVEKIVGLFINTIPVRIQLESSATFQRLIVDTQRANLQSSIHQNYSLAEIQSLTSVRNDLVNHIVIIDNYPADVLMDHLKHDDKQVNLVSDVSVFEQTNYDLNVNIDFHGNLRVIFNYNGNVFERDAIKKTAAQFRKILDQVANDPTIKLDDISILTDEDVLLLKTFNSTQRDFPKEKSLVELFLETASRKPDAIAFVCDDDEISFQELNLRSNMLANTLLAAGVKKGDIVPVLYHRSIDFAVAILSIFKAGAAYVPLDPESPVNRLCDIIAECKSTVFITGNAMFTSAFSTRCETETSLREVVYLDHAEVERSPITKLAFRDRRAWMQADHTDPDIAIDASSLVYVIYTSGSSGKPKGVMIENVGMVNHIFAKINDLHIDDTSVIAQNATQCFDISVWQFLTGLVSGSKTVIYGSEIVLDPQRLLDRMNQDKVTILEVVPSYLLVMLDLIKYMNVGEVMTTLKYLLVTGEIVKSSLVREWFLNFPSISMVNAYGPTEASDDITHYVMTADPSTKNISIGKPIQNLNIYITDQAMNLCPLEVKGEICVSGVGVGRGYLNDAEKTSKAFMNDPFAEGTIRLYKTGDTGRWLRDGTIEFFGRKDYQVKIRGHRIELSEIENAMIASGVKEALAVVKEDQHGVKYLVGYYTLNQSSNEGSAELKRALEKILPPYMVPSHLVLMEAFQLNSNGKIDRRNIPDVPTTEQQLIDPSHAPGVGNGLLVIYRNVLENGDFSIHDNFFDHGGHSLKAIQLMTQIHKHLHVKIGLRDIFEYPTPHMLDRVINKKRLEKFTTIDRIAEQAYYPISHAQKRLWILSQFDHGSVAYNISLTNIIAGEVSVDELRRAFGILQARHESLRTLFKVVDGVPYQVIKSQDDVSLEFSFIDFTGTEKTRTLDSIVHDETTKRFDLEQAGLFRVLVVRLDNDKHLFVFTMHHIISDATSMQVLFKELNVVYQSLLKKRDYNLPSLQIQYRDFTAWQARLLRDEGINRHRSYWHHVFSDAIAPLELPTDFIRPTVKTFNGASISFEVPQHLTLALRSLAKSNGASMFTVMFSAVTTLLYKYTGQSDVVVGFTTPGRDHADLENVIGFFVNTLPVRTRFKSSDSFSALLQNVKGNILDAFEHQLFPLDVLLEELALHRDTSRSPLFDVLVEYQGPVNEDGLQAGDSWTLGPGDLKEYQAASTHSKFDITFFFNETPAAVEIVVEYNANLFKRERVVRLREHFIGLLNAITVSSHETSLHSLQYLSESECQALCNNFKGVAVEQFISTGIIEQFERCVSQMPDAIAVVCQEERISYRALSERSNLLSRHLISERQVGPGVHVGIMMERSPAMIVSMLAIMKCGAAFVPIDPEYPLERVTYMAKESEISCMLIHASIMQKAADCYSGELVAVDLDLGATDGEAKIVMPAANLDDICYLNFTSGSTGKPKGVGVAFGNINNYINWANDFYFNNESGFHFPLFTSLSFDLTLTSILSPLLRGDTLYVYETEDIAMLLASVFNDSRVTAIKITPSHIAMLNHLPVTETNIRVAIVGGEALTHQHVDILRRLNPEMKIYNEYGPTETTVGCIVREVDGSHPILNIGHPIANTSIYILNGDGQLLPLHEVGEICVAGAGVSRGYWRREEITNEKFVQLKVNGNERIYRTGDLGRCVADGSFEYLGRRDDQVKVRGHRIELGEIQRNILTMDGVTDAVVVCREINKDTVIAAYYTAAEEISIEVFKDHLARFLPVYMVPTFFARIERIPLTVNGKVNVSLLPTVGVSTTFVEPQSPIEIVLANIWQEVLAVERVGIDDNFFALGGNSIKVVEVVNLINHQYENKLKVTDLFNYGTIRELAPLLQGDSTVVVAEEKFDEFEL